MCYLSLSQREIKRDFIIANLSFLHKMGDELIKIFIKNDVDL
jgi:hypothetical protein